MTRLNRTLTLCVVLAGGTLMLSSNARSQTATGATVEKTVVSRADSSVPGREAIGIAVVIPPGAETGRHTHPGDEIDYVLEGTGELVMDGHAPLPMKPGASNIIPGGTVHNARNTGTQPLKVWAVLHVEKGKPLTVDIK